MPTNARPGSILARSSKIVTDEPETAQQDLSHATLDPTMEPSDSSSPRLVLVEATYVTAERNDARDYRTTEQRVSGLRQSPVPDCTNNHNTDRQRTKLRFEAALSILKEAIDTRPSSWNQFDIPDFNQLRDGIGGLSLLQSEGEKMLNSRKNKNPSVSVWERGKEMLERIFMAMSPAATNILTIAKQAQEVLSSR